jgi:TonB family protein
MTGTVVKTMLKEPSGYPTLDEAALKVAEMMRFEPAVNRDKHVAVWVAIPIMFRPKPRDLVGFERERAVAENGVEKVTPRRVDRPDVKIPPGPPVAGQSEIITDLPVPPKSSRLILQQPVFTPYTVAPRLVNTGEVQRALERRYPPLLRNAGIGGQVVVWFFIDETGRVVNNQIKNSSGYPTLDEAALMVAEMMRFEPALNRDQRVSVWVAIPLKFDTKE